MELSFDLALAHAIAWCAPRADLDDPVHCLRTPDQRPKLLGDRREAVEEVVNGRQWETEGASPVQSAADLQGGRLLVYFPDEDLADGAAEAESLGFFDFDSAPPWDTWVAFLGEEMPIDPSGPYLVSWVPPSFIDLAEAGIRASLIDECIRWLDDADVPLRAELRERGVIA